MKGKNMLMKKIWIGINSGEKQVHPPKRFFPARGVHYLLTGQRKESTVLCLVV
jgi:hypothetical protein